MFVLKICFMSTFCLLGLLSSRSRNLVFWILIIRLWDTIEILGTFVNLHLNIKCSYIWGIWKNAIISMHFAMLEQLLHLALWIWVFIVTLALAIAWSSCIVLCFIFNKSNLNLCALHWTSAKSKLRSHLSASPFMFLFQFGIFLYFFLHYYSFWTIFYLFWKSSIASAEMSR